VSYFDKNPFVFLLATGAVLSVLVRILLGDSSLVSLLAIGVCLACLGVYYRKVSGAGMHGPDNCYYMGLLFTLVSLIYSLITLFLLNVGDHDVAERTNNLIGSFGIALFSTFAGILCRILLLQKGGAKTREEAGARPPDSIEILIPRQPAPESRREQHPPALYPPTTDDTPQTSEVTEASWHQAGATWHVGDVDLAEAALKLRMALNQTVADMNVFREGIMQAANETRAAMAEQAKKAAEEQTKTLSTLSATAVEKLADTVDQIAASIHDELAQTVADMSAARNAVSQASEETVQAANRARLAIIQQAEQAAAEHAETLSSLSTATAANISGAANELADSIGDIKNALAGLSASHASQAARVDDASQKIASGGERLADSFAPMVAALQGVVDGLQSANRDAQAVFANYDSLNAKLRQSVLSFNQIQHDIEQSAKGLAASTEHVSRSLVHAAESAPRYAEQLQEMTAALRGEMEKWQSMTEEVRTSLVQAVNKLTEVIKRGS